MNKKKIIYVIIAVFTFAIVTTGVILAAPNIQLSVTTSGDTATLTWTNSDTVDVYNYSIKRKKKAEDYKEIYNAASKPVRVLNVHPGAGSNISFKTYDGESVTVTKSASLKKWMEEPNGEDAKGYGRGLIEVTPVSFDAFNANPTQYLNKNGGEYNQDVILFGTWDANSGKDLTLASSQLVEEFINAGNGVIFGHDTIANISNSSELNHPNFVRLAKYVNMVPGTSWTSNHDTKVKISKNGVFTMYPWNIGNEGKILTIPTTHDLGQTANGDIWMTFDNNIITGRQNFYLTTYRNCAMIQTGHSNCDATSDEQKILANLIFYLADLDSELKFEDKDFKDVDAPDAPVIQDKTLNGVNGQVSYTATDNGTTYNYYVEALEKVSQQLTTSNTVTKERKTEVAGYSYVVDNKSDTVPDNTIDTNDSQLNYTLTDGPETWLHIRAIDGAGNVGPVTHILLHTNVPPEMELTQNPTKWTNQDVTITATATDEDGRVVSIKNPEGTVVDGDNTTYVVTKNGTYEFVATDNSGATTTKSIEITNIDKVNPEGTFEIAQPTKDVRAAVITFTATDDASGVAKIILPDNSEVSVPNEEVLSKQVTYNVTEPGKYKFIIHDVAGNDNEVWVDVVIKSDGVVVKYIDNLHKENEISPAINLSGNVGETYTTQEAIVPGYKLVVTPDNANGKYTIDEQVVTYEYKHEAKIVVKYVDVNTGLNIDESQNTTEVYLEGDEYTTQQKEFSGYRATSATQNTSGTVEREDIEVIYYYKKVAGGVEGIYREELHPEHEIYARFNQTGLEKDAYNVPSRLIEGYALTNTIGNPVGEMTIDKITVIYEYRKLIGVTERHIDINTGKDIITPERREYQEQTEYSTSSKEIPGYRLVVTPDNTEGTVGQEDFEVVYEYKRISAGVETRFVDQVTGTEIESRVTQEGLEGEEYTTAPKVIEGYTQVGTPANAKGEFKEELTVVTYEYRKNSKVIVHHVDENTGREIINPTETTYKEGDRYTALPQSIEGYVVTKEPEQKEGVVGRENIEVTYYYKKGSAGLTVKYVDEKTGDLLDQKEYTGNENDVIQLEEKSFENYVLVLKPKKAEVVLTVEAQEVIYYYRRIVKLNVKGVVQSTDEVLYTSSQNGIEGDKYTTTPMEIPGYAVVVTPDNATGEYSRDGQDVIYYYDKNSKGVLVKHIDIDTNEVLKEYTISGAVGDKYDTQKEEYEKYTFVRVDGSPSGTMTEDLTTVNYYYQKKVGKVVVIYEDKEGNQIYKEELLGKVDEAFKLEEKKIENYRIVERPENTEGTYKLEEQVFKFILEKIPGKVTVQIVDEDGNIIGEETVEGYVGENAEIELPDIDGYYNDGDRVVNVEYKEEETIIQVKYKKMPELPETGDINVILMLIIAIVSTTCITLRFNKY